MVSRKGDALVHLGVRTKKSDALASPFPLTSVPALRSHLCVALSSDTVKSETMIPSRAEYFKQPAGRLLWPGLAGNYDPAGRGKRLYAIALQNLCHIVFIKREKGRIMYNLYYILFYTVVFEECDFLSAGFMR